MRYLAYSILSVTMTLIAWLLCWLLPVFVRNGQYPKWLGWFQTPDAPAWGDYLFHENQMAWTKGMPETLRLYLCAMFWQFRNPAHGMDLFLGADIDPMEIGLAERMKVSGDLSITNGASEWGIHGKHGWFLVTYRDYFHLRVIFPIWSGMCVMTELGWRLRGIAAYEPMDICRQFVFTPFRFKKFIN